MEMLTSAQNPRLKRVRALLTQSKARKQENRVVLEGERLIRDVYEQGYIPDLVLCHPDFSASKLVGDLWDKDITSFTVDPKLWSDFTDTEHSQGIIAVFPAPRIELSPKASLLIAVDGVRDPGNLGTIIRTAAAAGADGVMLMHGTVDALNPKALRSGMGAHYRLPVFSADWERLSERLGEGWTWIAADANMLESGPYTGEQWQEKTVLILGNEAHGISAEGKKHAERAVFIPMALGVESLNSAVAAAIILYEIQRQRGKFNAPE